MSAYWVAWLRGAPRAVDATLKNWTRPWLSGERDENGGMPVCQTSRHRSLRMDARILLRTIVVLLAGTERSVRRFRDSGLEL